MTLPTRGRASLAVGTNRPLTRPRPRLVGLPGCPGPVMRYDPGAPFSALTWLLWVNRAFRSASVALALLNYASASARSPRCWASRPSAASALGCRFPRCHQGTPGPQDALGWPAIQDHVPRYGCRQWQPRGRSQGPRRPRRVAQPAKGGHRLGVAGLGGSVERLPSEPMAELGQPTTFGHPSAIKVDQRKHGQGDPSSSIEAGC
jgi:hypothetical protein